MLHSQVAMYVYSGKICKFFFNLQLHYSVKMLFKKAKFGRRLILNL